MKQLKLTTLLCCLTICIANAQDSSWAKSKTFKVKATEEVFRTGYISAFSDSTLSFSSQPVKFSPYSSIRNVDKQIHYADLQKAFVKRKGSAGRGALIGTISGALLGAAMGFASGSDEGCKNPVGTIGNLTVCLAPMSAADKATVGSVFFGFTGGVLGLIVGALSGKEFLVEGKRENFNLLRSNLIKRATKKKYRKSNGNVSL